jgi:putative ABC transport system permease protein
VTTRLRDLAVREVLGASRNQLIAMLVLEGLALALVAGGLGVGLSYWGLGLIKSLLPSELARASTIAIDSRVLGVSLAVIVLCGLVFSSAPAWVASRLNIFSAARVGTAVIGGRRQHRALSAFLIGEVAFVTILLVATTLVVTTFVVVTTIDMGFDRHNLFALGVQKSFRDLPQADRDRSASAFNASLLERVRSVPGVERAAFIGTGMPLVGGTSSSNVRLPGESAPGTHMFEVREVSSGYFDTLHLPIVRGRAIDASDQPATPHVAVINEAAARRYFANTDPIGAILTFRGSLTVVGVVRDVRNFGPEMTPEPQMYVAINQLGSPGEGDIIVRAAGDLGAVSERVRIAAREFLNDDEVFRARFVEDAFWRRTAGRRFNAGLMGAFGGMALLIGALGVYATMAFVVAQDVRGIGLRLALGATPGRIRRGVLWAAARRVGAGAIVGLAGAWATSQAMSSLVFGVAPSSPTVYVSVCAILGLVALIAALVPAIRASSLDPLRALRTE